MKILKIIFKGVVPILLVLLLIFYVVLGYREYKSYINVLPANVDKVVKVKVDDLAIEYFLSKVKGEVKSIDTKNDERLNTGIYVPANVLLYTVKNKKSTTIFTTLPIWDSLDATNLLKKKYHFQQVSDSLGYTYLMKNDYQWSAALTNDKMMICYAANKEKVQDVFHSVLVDHLFLSEEEYLFNSIKEADNDVTILGSSAIDHIAIDLSRSRIEIDGVWEGVFRKRKQSDVTKPFKRDTTVAIKFLMNGAPYMASGNFNIGGYQLTYDSIVKYSNNFGLEVKGVTNQQESAVTYEYNDDFEKIPVVSYKNVTVPNIQMQLDAGDAVEDLEHYLRTQQIVKDSIVNKEVFPLYTLLVNNTSTSLKGTTNFDVSRDLDLILPDDSLLYLYINFNTLFQYKELSAFSNYSKDIKDFELRINSSGELYTIYGELNFKGSVINPLELLIR